MPPRPRGPGAGAGSVGAGAGAASASGTAVVMKTLSAQMTGEECPLPGTAYFQATCSLSLHDSGASPRAMPLSEGPRQRGQSSSAAAAAAAAAAGASETMGRASRKRPQANRKEIERDIGKIVPQKTQAREASWSNLDASRARQP